MVAHLCSRNIQQFEKLLHQNLVDLHQNHIHPIPVDQRQVSVTLQTNTHNDVTAMSHITTKAAVSHPLGLRGLYEDQREETKTHFLVLLLTFTHLQER